MTDVATEKVRTLADVDRVPAQRGDAPRKTKSNSNGVPKLPGHLGVTPQAKGATPLPGFTVGDLYAEEKPSPYICKGVLEFGDMMVVFGESGAMKSFWTLDLLMHIATGRDYCGHRINRTGVLLIAGEGGKGMKRRLKAWVIRHGFTEHEPNPPILIATQAANLMFDDGTIRATIELAESKLGIPIGVVCFDTLAASFGEGDENATKDMNQALATARQSCAGRAVVLVHHVGHGQKDRERGAYSLRANADWRVLVERSNDGSVVTVTCLKSKDGEPFKPMSFRWRQVDTGWVDADGDPVTSVVLDPTDYVPVVDEPSGAIQKEVLAELRAEPTKKAALVKHLEAKGHRRTSVYRAIDSLDADGLISVGMDGKLRAIEAQE